MGALKASNNQYLLTGETKNAQEKGKHKGKEKKNIDYNTKENQNHLEGASGSNRDKHKKLEKTKCSYYKRGFHTKNQCMKKTIK